MSNMNEDQKSRIKELAKKPKLTKEEWEEYEALIRLQYETGENDPKPAVEETEEQPN